MTDLSNAQWYERGNAVLPGGVCSSTRLNQGIGSPVYVARSDGSRFTDVDGREYIDMSCGHGAALLGHNHPAIRDALIQAAELGICCAADMPYHIQLAELLCELIPCAEKIRFTNSGSEATLHAIRLCRAVSGKDKILRFTGHFHGYHEHTFIGGHPPREAMHAPSEYRESAGIPEPLTQFIVTAPFNDLMAAREALEENIGEIGTVILEPVNFNTAGIPPQPGYLEGLRDITREFGAILFFDEVQTSFKKSAGGAQQDFGVIPDICTIGKALGGGLPLSAICGTAQMMDRFKPVGDVQHSGTFNAPLPNILAGLAFCRAVTHASFYPDLAGVGDPFYEALDQIIADSDLPVHAPRHGARFGLIMGVEKNPVCYEETLDHRKDLMLAFVGECARRGVYFHDYGGAPCHHGFSSAHTTDDMNAVLDVVAEVLKTIS